MQNFGKSVFNQWVSLIRPNERVAVSLSFAWFFLVMFSYQLLRPIRESLASELDKEEKSWLFAATFVAMLAAVPLYGKLVEIFKRRQLIMTLFGLFTVSILAFSLWNSRLMSQAGETTEPRAVSEIETSLPSMNALSDNPESEQKPIASEKAWMIRVFFVWVSVFALYATSLVWSVLIDIFSNEQSKRLFGVIAGGATAGAITASTLALSAKRIGTTRILLLSAIILAFSSLWFLAIERITRNWPSSEKAPKNQGGMFSGISDVVRSGYLLQMILYIALISIFGGVIYMRLTEAAKAEIADVELRTAYFAQLNLYVQLGTLLVQSLLIGPVMRKLGLSFSLALLPCIATICFMAMYFRSDLMIIGIVDVVSRVTTYGFSVPSREVLFTVVSREAKYKAKNVIDTIVIRGADAISSSLYGTAMHFVSFPILCLTLLPLAGLWYYLAIKLGRQQAKLAQAAQRQ